MTSSAVSPLREGSGASHREHSVVSWFRDLNEGTPGARAKLRRCRSRTEALMEPMAVALVNRMGAFANRTSIDDNRVGSILDLARVLSHVKVHDGSKRTMQFAGWRTFPGNRKESDAGDDRPKLSQMRFRRLLTTQNGEALVAAFSRLVRLLEGTVNVNELATDFIDWSHPIRGQHVRSKWAFDYYAAGTSAPAASETLTDVEVGQ